jgi:HEAT repeat protein
MINPVNTFRLFVAALLLLLWAGCTTTPKNPASRAALAVLNSEAGLHEKARACQELGVVGGPEAVPALAGLLSHEQLADYARSGLEGIADPAAGAALRQALGTLQGRSLAGAVNSLGVRREVAAVPELEKLALDPARGVAAEALASLGMIGTVEAAETLQQIVQNGPEALRIAAAHASLVAAERLAQAGNSSGARSVLESVIRSLPPGHLQTVAQNQLTALAARPAR